MKISVIGLWHLGCVTAACLAEKGFNVTGYDKDKEVVDNLNSAILPIFEPGLEELVRENIERKRLFFVSDLTAISTSDLIWITYDTPVDDQDNADTKFVSQEIESLFQYLKDGSSVLVSAQLPVGSIESLEINFRNRFPDKEVSFSCSPENLRLGKAIDIFMNPDRIIAGIRNNADKDKLLPVLGSITENIIWMKVESAEMTKHALNAFLATSVVFINELATLCEFVGADASEVERGLKSEIRIGEKAYLRPGTAFAGGTLARDVTYIIQKEKQFKLSSVFFSGVIHSNENHKNWVKLKLKTRFNSIGNKTIGLLGLTYKPGTDTLRRSTAVELCHWLNEQKANIVAYDPVVKKLPAELSKFVSLQKSVEDVFMKSDAIIIATEWPQFKNLDSLDISALPVGFSIFDANAFLKNKLDIHSVNYFSIGQSL